MVCWIRAVQVCCAFVWVLCCWITPSAVAQDSWFGDTWFGETWFSSDASPWKGTFASGLNARSGNANTMDINLNLIANRETELNTTNLIGNYFYGRNNSTTVNDRGFGQVRRERKLSDLWSLYFQAGLELDRFRDFDYRIALHSGFTRQIYKTERGFLKGRLGAGASREVGAPNDEWVPELQIGADWEHQLTEAIKLFAIVDYYPNVSDWSDFRFVSNVGLNYLISAPRDLSLRLFAQNRFDSTPPPGNVNNDIDYGVALSFGF